MPNRVQRISNPTQIGTLTGRSRDLGATVYLEVQMDAGTARFVPEVDLRELEALPEGIEDLLRAAQFGSIGDLGRVLAYHKIGSNLSNVFYAMQSSRTEFHAYQFKPVYKFIESFDNRLLIADEVGLGKTIEAGLIWLEALARESARRLLVVCPSMLRDKWKNELRFRFNVRNAEIYNANKLCELLEAFEEEGDNFECAIVCSLQSIRQDSVQEALAKVEVKNYRFDLVIVDEAHHLRNSNTKSHAVGKLLSDTSNSMVLLTATPIQLGNQDLYQLLHILNSEQFDQQWLFEELIKNNQPIVQAQTLLRLHPPRVNDAIDELNKLADNQLFSNDPNYSRTLEKLANLDVENRRELVETGLLLEKLNLLSSHISRTRKREVVEWRVVRNSQSLEVKFSPQEMQFYNAVTQAVQDRVGVGSDNRVSAFSLMMPQRRVASCIPAMVEYYRTGIVGGGDEDRDLTEELGYEFGEEPANQVQENWAELERLILNWDQSVPDTKFEVLSDALNERFEREPDAKVIIFSFFKGTLAYLARRLEQNDYGPILIHGDVQMQERQELIEQFRSSPNNRILLSSEVGAEGIDLQFCRVMFNYDLPWNPMKVEQRIGRIDRLGQKAESISIVNFAVRGTIEEKILNRLYTRIGIFERSIGALEPILGEKSQQLEFELLSRHLTPEQQEQRIEETYQAIEHERQLEDQLVEQSSVFLGSADYILDQIGIAREVGRRITSDDIRLFIEDFFQTSNYYGATIKWDSPEHGLVEISLPPTARNDLRTYWQNHVPRLPITSLTGSRGDCVTLIYNSELAQDRPGLELLSHFHPFIKWIKSKYEEDSNLLAKTAAVRVATEILPRGDYLIAIYLWNFDGIKSSNRIEYEIASIGTETQLGSLDAEKLIADILHKGTTWEFAAQSLDIEAVLNAYNECTTSNFERMESAFNDFRIDTENLVERRRQHLHAFSARKIESIERAIETMENKNAPENRISGFRAMLENRRLQTEEEERILNERMQASYDLQEIAAFVCRVG